MKLQRRKAPARDTQFDLAVRLHRDGRLADAEAGYRRVLHLQPAHPGALSNLGALLRRTGRYAEAVATLEKAVSVSPGMAGAWSNLCNLYRDVGRIPEAVTAGYRATELAPSDVPALSNLGNALFHADRFDEAKVALERALAIDPNYPNAWNNLGNVHQRQCRIDEAIACYERAMRLDPGHVTAHSNALFCMHFTPRYSPQEIGDAHRAWAAQHEAPLAARRLPERPIDLQAPVLKVGMLSADLREHPVADFLKPLVRNWPAQRLSLHLYSAATSHDAMSRWFQTQAAGWRHVAGMDDEALAHQIRSDGIDVLIDLTGHTANHRLLAFARRPAPVQATWLGYFDTSGMAAMDFLIADPICVRPDEGGRYAEKVVCLPQDFVCYEPPADAPEVGPLPAKTAGVITFGSQNQLAKVTDEAIRLWAQLILEIPNSRLLLGGKAFNDESTKAGFLEKFTAAGLSGERLVLRPGTSKLGVLATYNEIDIALDPFPCAGGTTTCEALWMGVPVVSLYGERFGGRHSASHLAAVGVGGFVTRDAKAYRTLAQRLACDLPSLAGLRASLREQMRRSPLCDGAAFAANFLKAVETMWRVKAKAAGATAP
jgi:predicted O-linked N-acetylglucosamine transferase (SPINDLY family)